MKRRISAMHMIVSLIVSCVELLIAVSFLLKIFGSDNTLQWILENVEMAVSQTGNGVSSVAQSSETNGPIAFLLLVLGFMMTCSFLVTVFPKLIKRVEENMETETEWEVD
jgi:hypothetical protein